MYTFTIKSRPPACVVYTAVKEHTCVGYNLWVIPAHSGLLVIERVLYEHLANRLREIHLVVSHMPATPSLCTNPSHFVQKGSSITTSIPPPSPPPLLPLTTIKTPFSQLDIDSIMRLAHPPPELVPITDLRLIALLHPRLEIVRANPARIQLTEQAYELFHFGLLDG